MSVVIFPRRHAGERQPSAFVIRLPGIQDASKAVVVSGVDLGTLEVISAEVDRLDAAFAEATKISDRIVELVRPFIVEGTQ